MDRWLAFARTGNPNVTPGPIWKTYERTERATMELGYEIRSVNNPLAETTTYDATQVTSGDMWALSFWNSVDNAAARIRADVNKPNRVPADANNMAIAIYVIGYSGNGGVDQGLLKRVANDKSSSSYDATQPTGIYVPAGNKTALANAFNTIYTAILRLAK
jgi:hypothetical protein